MKKGGTKIEIIEKDINPNSILNKTETTNDDNTKSISFNNVDDTYKKDDIQIFYITVPTTEGRTLLINKLNYTDNNSEYKTSLEPMIIKIRELEKALDYINKVMVQATKMRNKKK